MSACPNCGAIPRPNDKFCNTCGTPVPGPQGQNQGAYGPPAAAPAYAPPQAQWGGQQGGQGPARCQLGHEIAPGQNYCMQGHPIALEGVQFAGNPQQQPYGGQPGYGGQPYAQPAPQYGGGGGGAAPGYAGGQQQAPYAYGPQGGYAPPQQAYAPPQPAYSPPQPLPGYKPPPGVNDDPNAAAQVQGRVLRGFLVSYQVNPLGDFWALHSGRLTIGRSNSGEALDVPLADATISSRHAALSVDPGAGPIQLEDTGSTNGTFVNDEHLGFNGRRELRDGDRVRFGGYTAIIKVITR
jgi:hypothetical protein